MGSKEVLFLHVSTLCSPLQGPQGLVGIAGVLGAPGEKVRRVFLCHYAVSRHQLLSHQWQTPVIRAVLAVLARGAPCVQNTASK